MRFHRYKRLATALTIYLGLALSGGTVLAGSMTIGLVKPNEGYIVLDDRLFLLTPATRVLSSGGAPVAATALKKGMKVTIQVQSAPSGSRPVLEEIRISP